MTNPELSAVISRYVSAWVGDATPPNDSEDGATAKALSNTAPDISCTLVPLTRFLREYNKALVPGVHSFVSHSERVRPPELRCEDCNITAPSQDHLNKHMLSAKHRRRMQLIAIDADIAREFVPGGLVEKLEFAKWRCVPCNAKMCASVVSTHMAGVRHLSNCASTRSAIAPDRLSTTCVPRAMSLSPRSTLSLRTWTLPRTTACRIWQRRREAFLLTPPTAFSPTASVRRSTSPPSSRRHVRRGKYLHRRRGHQTYSPHTRPRPLRMSR